MRVIIGRATGFAGTAAVPGDKSISHRALILGALATGRTRVINAGPGADVRSTAAVLRALGVPLETADGDSVIEGVGLHGLRAPDAVLDCGNSGTTVRLLAGVLAGAGIPAVLDGDESLRRRPMGRILAPLRAMGARCDGTRVPGGGETVPIRLSGGARLTGVRHDLRVASAQVKSCLLLAGLYADGVTRVREPHPSRDHTERLLAALGAPLAREPDGAWAIRRPDGPLRAPLARERDDAAAVRPPDRPLGAPLARERDDAAAVRPPDRPLGAPLAWRPEGAAAIGCPEHPVAAPDAPSAPARECHLEIPGDPSSAAFPVAAALLVPGGAVALPGVLANPTRTGFFRALARMGADLVLRPGPNRAGEPTATVEARHGSLVATEIPAEEIPSLVDEVPLLAVVATQARGRTVVRGAAELRVKESDRLAGIAAGLRAMGARIEELPDGLVIDGPTPLTGAALDAHRDHRLAMAFAVAGLSAEGTTTVDGAEWADVSWPGFFDLLARLSGGACTGPMAP